MSKNQIICKSEPDCANVGTSLMKSVFSAGAGDIASDVAEMALDAVLDEGVLKEVPVFGWFIKGYGVVATIKDRLFLKKIAMFLHGASQSSNHNKQEFQNKLESDLFFCQKVGENLILLLDRHDNLDKAYLLGKVFSGYLSGQIDYGMFLRLAAAIDRTFITDLKNLQSYYDRMKSYDPKLGKPFSEFLDDEIAQSLYNAGLARSESYVEDTYHPSVVGSCLIDLVK